MDYRLQPNLLDRLEEPPRKVAIVRASRLGDFICATPALRALRARLPETEISLIALPFAEELARRSPYVDRFVGFPGFPGMAEQFFDPERVLAFARSLRHDPFDLALQMHGSGVNANPFTLMLGASVTAGFIRPGDPPGGLNAAFVWNPARHEIWRCLELAGFLGAPSLGERTEFVLLEQDHEEAERVLMEAEPPLIGVHPGAAEAVKRWPAARFGAAAGALQRRLGGPVVVRGARSERRQAAAVAAAAGKRVVNLAGQTSLPVMGAVMARLALLLANDSGPAHIAYALDVPSVTVFGGTRPEEWGPLVPGKHQVAVSAAECRPCTGDACPDGYGCLQQITPDMVEELALRAGQYHRHLHGELPATPERRVLPVEITDVSPVRLGHAEPRN